MPEDDKIERILRTTYAPLATVERYHTEEKAWRDRHMAEHAELRDRLNRAEWEQKQTAARLTEGSKTFEAIREAIEKSKPKPLSRTQLVGLILGPILGAAIVVGGIVWSLAKYPNREEIEKRETQVTVKIEKADKKVEDLTKTVGEIQSVQAVQAVHLQTISDAVKETAKAQTAMDTKLDRALRAPRGP